MLAKPKVTAVKILLAKGRSPRHITKRIRVGLASIAAISSGVMYCGHKDSRAYYPSQAAIVKHREELYKENPKPKWDGRRKMTKQDICNVEPVSDTELMGAIELLIGPSIANGEAILEERWSTVDASVCPEEVLSCHA